jgi:BirA family transcriptional regulator, biotin operon repressor / biotin---[acetyl-CoA-carboxylase] ligase
MIPPEIIFLDEAESTNDYLQDLMLRDNLQPFTVISSEHQTRGRGRNDNVWHSEPSMNLTFSMYFKTCINETDKLFRMNKAVAVGIAVFLGKELHEYEIHIKWPNDILVSGRKIAGILIENIFSDEMIHSIIGIGLNVNQLVFPETDYGAVSMKNLTGKEYQTHECLRALTKVLKHQIHISQSDQWQQISEQYHQLLFQRDEERPYLIDGVRCKAVILDVDEYGKLHVLNTTTRRKQLLDHGNVKYLF